MISRDQRIVCGAVALLAAASWAVSAHELERTEITLSFNRDGAFVLEIANDPNWLLLRLESFAGGQVPAGMTPEARDRRLAELSAVFIDRVVLFVDGREIRPQAADYVAPRPQTPDDPYPPQGLFRLRGRMPADAKTLRWLYGLVIDPYQLTIRWADGASSGEWIDGSNWSGVINLAGQFRQTTRLDTVREYVRLGFRDVLPQGVDQLLFVLGLFLLTIDVRTIAVQLLTLWLGSSLGLVLATYGILSPSLSAIEPLIAIAIAYVAIENLITSALKPWRLVLVFLFGMIFGAKSAAVLSIPIASIEAPLVAVLSFVAGTAAAQATAVAAAAFAVAWYRHQPWYHRRIVVPASLSIAVVGIYWTLLRTFA